MNDDFASFTTHMEGLARLIQLRGGFEAIEQNLMLRRIVFRYVRPIVFSSKMRIVRENIKICIV